MDMHNYIHHCSNLVRHFWHTVLLIPAIAPPTLPWVHYIIPVPYFTTAADVDPLAGLGGPGRHGIPASLAGLSLEVSTRQLFAKHGQSAWKMQHFITGSIDQVLDSRHDAERPCSSNRTNTATRRSGSLVSNPGRAAEMQAQRAHRRASVITVRQHSLSQQPLMG